MLEEKTRRDKAREAYQEAISKYTSHSTKLLDWIETNWEMKEQAKQNFTNTEHAFKPYNQAHPDRQILSAQKNLNSLTFISQASSRNKASCLLLAAAYLSSTLAM